MPEKIIEHSSLSMYESDMVKYSIIVNRRRAIPEVRDGLKPVQRRVLFGAYKDGLTSPGRKDKSASLVGTVMKYYHPHGNCLRANTPLYCLDGNFRTIGELYYSGVDTVEVLAIDTKTNKVVPVTAHSFRIGQHTRKLYHLKFSNGYTLTCTEEHPILTAKNGWVKARDLNYSNRLLRKKIYLNSRLSIDKEYLHKIVADYYTGPAPKGFERHHINRNIYDNRISNLATISKHEHVIEHSHEEWVLSSLEAGRKKMFSEDGEFREKTRRKNSILMSEFNKDQGIRRFKSVIEDMKSKGLEITEENYEKYRDTVYNLPIVSRLIERYPQYGKTFNDLVNYEMQNIGDSYNDIMSNVSSPIEFDDSVDSSISPIDFFHDTRCAIYNIFDRIIEKGLPLTLDNYHNEVSESMVDDMKIIYLIRLYNIECPFITSIEVEELDYDEPMFDFTVDGYENMLIPALSPENKIIENVIGYNIPMICVHNSSIYDTIVVLVNWYKTKMPLFYGKGNWGNVSGAGAAAERYTECSLSNFGYETLIEEIAQANNIVDWIPTYKRNNDKEPEYLPAKVPILLINGTFGIGVGMQVNIPSHNLVEVVEAVRLLLKNPKAPVVLIPDLCQPCHLIDADWKEISETGRGSFKVRGNINVETDKKGNTILRITSLPDGVSTNSVYDKILKMVEEKQMPMIKDIFNSLTKEGLPDIIIHLKQGADPNYVKQVLYSKTQVQDTISVNFEAVGTNGIDTRRFSYKDYLLTFIDQRMNTKFRLYCNKLQQVMTRHHQVDAFIKVLESGKIDTIIDLIRKQKGTDDTPIVEYIIKNVKITDIQAKFIINTNLSRLSIGHLNNYRAERKDLEAKIKTYQAAVTDDGSIIKNEIDLELQDIVKKYGSRRLCDVVKSDTENEIPKGTFKIVVTERNYIRKIVDTDKIGVVKKDNPKFIIKADNAENILIFDNKGKVFNLPVSKIPITDRNSSGTDIRILIRNLTSDIIAVFYEPIFKKIYDSGNKHYLTILTKSNTIKKLDIEDFLAVNPSGLMYSKIRDDDEVVGIVLAQAKLDVVICSGRNALRTTMKEIPLFKRNATGSKAMDTTDPINGLSVIYPDASDIVVVTKNGKFNRFNIAMLPVYARARKGVGVIKLDSNDEILNIFGVNESDKIRLVTTEGVEEVNVSDIKSKSRIVAGTKMIQSKGIIVRADVIR